MKRFLRLFAFCMLAFGCIRGINADIIEDAEKIHDSFDYINEKKFLLENLASAKTQSEKAEAYWRLSRVDLYLGDEAENKGVKKDDLLKYYEEGEKYADKAIGLFPKSCPALYWKASNIGRWGQVKGVLDSLGKAEPMQKLLIEALRINPDHADSYFVLGELYDEVPGWPIAFGNIDFAVSFARKSIALNEKEVEAGSGKKMSSYYIKLAKHLWKRNWDANKRRTEQPGKKNNYDSKTSVFDKGSYFEGIVAIREITDRDEAKELTDAVIKELGGIVSRDKTQNDNLKKANDLINSWK
jgi:tetratricopeptide (TPR) repeat protein